MIVECFGVPGSGKSTLVKKLVETGEYKTVPMYVGKWYALIFALRHPLFVSAWKWALVSECTKSHTWRLFRFKVAVFLDTIARMQYARSRFDRSDRVILDEGTLQRILSLYETQRSERSMRRWMRYLPQSDVVIETIYQGAALARKVGTERKKESPAYVASWLSIVAANRDTFGALIQQSDSARCAYTWNDAADSFADTLLCIRTNE